MDDIELLIRDKYNGDDSQKDEIVRDMERLAAGEPLAYVIGWIPFCGLQIFLEANGARPLIPRPETEWWTQKLIEHLQDRFGKDEAIDASVEQPFRLLDLCAGSGAIGLAILSKFPNAHISFGELNPGLADLIRKNILENGLDAGRAEIRTGDLFTPFENEQFDIIATNPPYVPSLRALDESVTNYEPPEALYSGVDGLELIRRITTEAPEHLSEGGELWMECDITNVVAAERLASLKFNETSIVNDQYGRPRLIIADVT
jgi:release factor glutamine methyltransferase